MDNYVQLRGIYLPFQNLKKMVNTSDGPLIASGGVQRPTNELEFLECFQCHKMPQRFYTLFLPFLP